MSTEIKVGIFVVIGILVLAYMTVNIEKIRFGKAVGYTVYVKLDSAAGLVKNSRVRIAGVQVGSVQDIVLEGETGKAKVALRFPFQIALPVDSLAFVKSEGLLGEKYIEIRPGSSKDIPIRKGGEIKQGDIPVDLDQLFTQLNSVATDIKGVTRSLNRVLGGKESEESLRKIFDNIEEITSDLNTTIKENKENFNTIMSNFGRLTGDLTGVSAKAGDTFDTINTVVKKIEEGEGSLGRLLADNSLYDQTRDAMANLNKIAERIESGDGTLGRLLVDRSLYDETMDAMASLNRIAKRIEKGEGTLGKLATDETLYTEAKKAIKKANKAAEGMQEQIPVTVLGTVLGTVLR